MKTAVLIAALALAPAASAAAPPGFTEAKVLEPAASYVAGKPAHIFCSQTIADWQDYSRANTTPDANGLTVVGSSQSELESTVCDVLRARLSRQPVSLYDLAASILILTHESLHQLGFADEGETECMAIHRMPRVAVRFFHVKPGKQLRALMAQAWQGHRDKPPAYQSVC